jgi:hypothetical protein
MGDAMVEEWKDIEGYEGRYYISSFGRVKSTGHGKDKYLKPMKTYKGYLCVDLRKPGYRKTIPVHRLVAIAFIPNINGYTQVNHIDCNKENNHVENIEWCDQSHNQLHAFANGLISRAGVKNSQAILTEKEVLEIYKLLSTHKYTHSEIASRYNVTKHAVGDINTGRSWAHLLSQGEEIKKVAGVS